MTIAVPNILTSPGTLRVAPIGSTAPSNTVVGSVFTDAYDAAWLQVGATEDGTDFSYGSTVEPVTPAEFFDAIAYYTTERHGSIAFNLMNFGLTNYRRAVNGGVTALAPTSGSGTTALYTVSPPDPGAEVRCMVAWESLDATLRLLIPQCIQGGEIASGFKKPPATAVIPCTYNFEKPSSGNIFTLYGAGASRA